ncbi:MAG: hypothetical protein ACOZF2_05445 [Thermodesulfobacteriota bacterium]
MAEIKSALELALEKAERYGRATKEELNLGQYRDQGRQLAVNFLKEGEDLKSGLAGLPAEARAEARKAVKEVLLRNINLPRNGEIDPRVAQALEGLFLVVQDQKAMARQKGELEQILQNFLQVRQSAYQQLKARFGANIGQMQRALEAQMRQRVNLEVEQIPQFQEEWRRFHGNLTDQFEPMLEAWKERILLL